MVLESPDWKNLDSMFFWKYVMPKSSHNVPRVVFLDYKIDITSLAKLANKHPEVSFLVESEKVPGGKEVFLKNVDYRWRERMEYWDWLKSWTTTDYVIVNEDDIEGWIQPALCGVKILFSEKDLPKEIVPVGTVSRIENWEWARTLLTKK